MKKENWKELPIGAIISEGGTAHSFKTGDWRSYKPILDEGKCVHCMLCWAFCPDSSIIIKDGKMVGFDYDHCKGCGICAVECPVKAIEMVKEKDE